MILRFTTAHDVIAASSLSHFGIPALGFRGHEKTPVRDGRGFG